MVLFRIGLVKGIVVILYIRHSHILSNFVMIKLMKYNVLSIV